MEDEFKISKPQQGVHTLVSELSILRLERTIKQLAEMRLKGSAEREILDYLDTKHKDLDQRSKTQIYRLSLGLTPKDDFTKDDLDSCKKLNDTTLEITLQRTNEQLSDCSLVFFEGQRWVVVSKTEATFVLKKF